MMTVFKTIVGTNNPDYQVSLVYLREEGETLLTQQEIAIIDYILEDWKITGRLSNPEIFLREFRAFYFV